jgi:hypothetical protein
MHTEPMAATLRTRILPCATYPPSTWHFPGRINKSLTAVDLSLVRHTNNYPSASTDNPGAAPVNSAVFFHALEWPGPHDSLPSHPGSHNQPFPALIPGVPGLTLM